MPTGPDDYGAGGAIAAARAEASQWISVASAWSPEGPLHQWTDVYPREADVVHFFDPADDLDRRGERWEYSFTDRGLSDVARFAAGLAEAEAGAWRDDAPHIATRAYSDRRFLVADRLLHWAVPWLDAVAGAYSDLASAARRDEEGMLLIGDHHRGAPATTGIEGLYPAGEDSIGPVERSVALDAWLGSLWSGSVLLEKRLAAFSILGDGGGNAPGTAFYRAAAGRWRDLADQHPGSARLWTDLSARASATANELAGSHEGEEP